MKKRELKNLSNEEKKKIRKAAAKVMGEKLLEEIKAKEKEETEDVTDQE